jgi:hypothetical protein
MKNFLITAFSAVILTFLLSACSPPSYRLASLTKFAPCDGRKSSRISRLDRASFSPTTNNSCVQSLEPADLAAWVEAPIVSFKERGLQRMVLGCANLTPDSADCQYNGMPGHAATLMINFNFATYPAEARVQKAVLAVRVENNGTFFTENAQVRGRLNIGDQLQSLGAKRTPPQGRSSQAGWVVFDITDFAARAVNEQRPSTSFEISLPCGRTEEELTTVDVLRSQPIVVVEYK